MKYWYLKNGDVVGPMSVEEIAKDAFMGKDMVLKRIRAALAYC